MPEKTDNCPMFLYQPPMVYVTPNSFWKWALSIVVAMLIFAVTLVFVSYSIHYEIQRHKEISLENRSVQTRVEGKLDALLLKHGHDEKK